MFNVSKEKRKYFLLALSLTVFVMDSQNAYSAQRTEDDDLAKAIAASLALAEQTQNQQTTEDEEIKKAIEQSLKEEENRKRAEAIEKAHQDHQNVAPQVSPTGYAQRFYGNEKYHQPNPNSTPEQIALMNHFNSQNEFMEYKTEASKRLMNRWGTLIKEDKFAAAQVMYQASQLVTTPFMDQSLLKSVVSLLDSAWNLRADANSKDKAIKMLLEAKTLMDNYYNNL